jgi:hypothetical protein
MPHALTLPGVEDLALNQGRAQSERQRHRQRQRQRQRDRERDTERETALNEKKKGTIFALITDLLSLHISSLCRPLSILN